VRGAALGARLTRYAERMSARRLALVLGACISVVVGIGALQLATAGTGGETAGGVIRGFDLGGEENVPATFSAALLGLASALALALSGVVSDPNLRRGVLAAFGALLGFFAVDEFLRVHERLAEWSGIEWQVIYLPVGLVGAALFALVWRGLRRFRPSDLLLLAAAGAWLISQVVERAQYTPGGRLTRSWTLVPEEALEMIGSTLLVLTFFSALQSTARRSGHTVA
jgi:hypothetical protein